jgi:uncharacterized membrane protein
MSGPLYFDATITPNRSLPRRGFQVLIGVMIAINLLFAGVFLAMGAFPVPVFLGLDVLGVIVAFTASYRGARQIERVQVTAEEVRVWVELGDRRRPVWRSPTVVTRVLIERFQDETRVSLALSGRTALVGGALSPDERLALGRAIEAAIGEARAERHSAL